MVHLTLNEKELKLVKVSLILCNQIIKSTIPIELIKEDFKDDFEEEVNTVEYLIQKINKAFENEVNS